MVFVFKMLVNSLIADEVPEVLVYRNVSMPYCGTIDGKNVGIAVDVLREVTKNGGPKFKFKELPYKRAQAYVQQNPGTAIIPFCRTPEREKQHTWIIKLAPNQVCFKLARSPKEHRFSIPSPVTLESLKNLPIGIMRGHSSIPYMKKIGFTNIEEATTPEQNAYKLEAGRIAAWVATDWVASYLWKKVGKKEEDLIAGPNLQEIQYIYLAAGLDFPPELTQQIRKAMSKVKKSGEIENIIKKWTKQNKELKLKKRKNE